MRENRAIKGQHFLHCCDVTTKIFPPSFASKSDILMLLFHLNFSEFLQFPFLLNFKLWSLYLLELFTESNRCRNVYFTCNVSKLIPMHKAREHTFGLQFHINYTIFCFLGTHIWICNLNINLPSNWLCSLST